MLTLAQMRRLIIFGEYLISAVKNTATIVSCCTGIIDLVTIVVKQFKNRASTFILQIVHTNEIENDAQKLSEQFQNFKSALLEKLEMI